MITPADLSGVDDGLARRIIAIARSIAPCLDSLDGEPAEDATAILLGVAAEARARGSRSVKSQRIGPAAVEYTSADTWFSADDRSALRALCSRAGGPFDPIGKFPRATTALNRLWPEREQC